MSEAYLGFYWTLPVNWAGFRDLPADVDAAAAVSRTIRYQRERVRGFAVENALRLTSEVAFMDVRPDRATDLMREALAHAAAAVPNRRLTLLTVAFEQIHLWRHNPHLRGAATESGVKVIDLSPDPLMIGGRLFDPIKHFSDWRQRDAAAMTRLRLAAHEGLQAALAEVPVGDGRWHAIADRLNGNGIKTMRGGQWTPENVRKLASRRQSKPR